MGDGDEVTIATADLRRVLHDYNNLTSRILTRAEVALLEDATQGHVAALEAICRAALELGELTRRTRDAFLGADD